MPKDSFACTAADMEPAASHAPLGTDAFEAFDTPVSIHIHSVRHRLTDADGISGKALIDSLVLSGVLQDDSPEFVKEVSYSQEKGETEYTVITIQRLRELEGKC